MSLYWALVITSLPATPGEREVTSQLSSVAKSKSEKNVAFTFAWCGLTIIRSNDLYSVPQVYVTNVLLYYFRWTELTRKIELCVEIHELNEQGEYMPVEVLHRNEVLTGGVFQLRQVGACSHQMHQCFTKGSFTPSDTGKL